MWVIHSNCCLLFVFDNSRWIQAVHGTSTNISVIENKKFVRCLLVFFLRSDRSFSFVFKFNVFDYLQICISYQCVNHIHNNDCFVLGITSILRINDTSRLVRRTPSKINEYQHVVADDYVWKARHNPLTREHAAWHRFRSIIWKTRRPPRWYTRTICRAVRLEPGKR